MQKQKTILPALFLVLALALVLYPPISNAYHARHHSAIETSYLAAMENTDAASLSAIRQAAEDYNSLLSGGTVTATVATYESLLNPNGDGIMCYVEIPKLGVSLPVYHGTEADTLADGVGHLVGSSLPVGGESTHAVLSGHSGLSGNKLFSDLDKLEKGDFFQLLVLGETLTYQVDSIATVLPSDTSRLKSEPGKDYVTLVTCTPYGVNTHRLLVRGHRVETPAAEVVPVQPAASSWEKSYIVGLAVSFGAAAIACAVWFAWRRHRRHT